MNRKLLNGLIVAAVALGGVGTFTSCKDEDYTNDLILGQKDLTEQIQAIRSITDSQFKTNLETWLNNWTSNASAGGFSNYDEMVAAANAMYKIYNDIMNNYPNISAETEKYISNLYDWMFNNEISKSDWYDLIFKVAERATSIEINQTYNPVLGSIDLPVGLKTTVLATYVVDGSFQDYSFPEDADMHLVNASPISQSNSAWAVIAQIAEGKTISNGMYSDTEGEGEMGGLYVNINPSSNDFTTDNYTLSIVDAKGAEVVSGDYLTITPNEDDLYFGVNTPNYSTRTEGGVYKVTVNVPEDNAFELIDLENAKDYLSDIKAAVKDKSISNIAYLGEQLYKNLNNKFKAYALEVAWEELVVDQTTGSASFLTRDGEEGDDENTEEGEGEVEGDDEGDNAGDSTSDKNTITNSVKSTYDIAAAIVHPLSYGLDLATLMGDAHLAGKYLPTFSPISEYLETISNKLDINVELTTGEVKSYTIEIDDTNNTLYIKDNEGNIVGDPNGYTYTGTVTSGDFNDVLVTVLNELNAESAAGTNDVIKNIQSSVDDLNAAIEPIKDLIERVKNSNKLHYADKLVEIYNKVAGKVNNVLANPNHYLQVAAIYSDGNGYYHHLSTNPVMPVVAGDAIELFLTSYTGDVVVPSLYKYVAITAVDGKAATAADNAKAGEMANYVMPGSQQRVALDLSSFSGQTLTLTYVSVDYHGATSAQNFYVTVQ